MSKNNTLWVERYRPDDLESYVFRDNRLKNQVATWLKEKMIPHLLLQGPAGTGKTTLANILIDKLTVPGDLLYINASDQTGVDTVREKIQNFVCSIPNGDFKIVLLEEADYLTPQALGALRRVMEDHSAGARFILTCNNVNKISKPIRSRCQEIEIKKLDFDSFKIRVVEILCNEGIGMDEDTLDNYIQVTYPDLRKCINIVQQNCLDGQLQQPQGSEGGGTIEWQVQAINLFKKGKISEARKVICNEIRLEDYEPFFELCYQNLEWWGDTEERQDQAIMIIAKYLTNHSLVAHPDINLAAMLVKLSKN